MRTLIVTTPIRPTPTYYPPMGSLSLLKTLRKNGFDDTEFYNIDGNRPSFEEAVDYICDRKPDVLGVSAVVSTAYAYTKDLTVAVKARCPETLIVVGGNLAASAEVLLKRTGTDLCALGEGEKVFLNVVRRAAETRDPADFADIPGLALLDRSGALINTGYEVPLKNEEIYDFDWDDLESTTDIGIFVHPVFGEGAALHPTFLADPRTHEPHRRKKNFTMVSDGKGCVAKCTFCHRWEKGMRYIPVELFMERLDELIERYDIGFMAIATENFGSDRRWVRAFCEEMKKRDVLWMAGAVRTKSVSPEMIAMMKESGCCSISYGMETGSPTILEVMEKKVSLQNNMDAQKWTVEAGFATVVQLVLGMPGESPTTIRETIDFCKYCFTLSPDLNPNNLSVNYAQALPGTPLYEYGRRIGLIGDDLDGEEEYLLRVSDRDAHDEYTTLNFTDYPTLICQTWRPRITIEVNNAYVEKFGIDAYRKILLADVDYFDALEDDDGYHANPKRTVKTATIGNADPTGDQAQALRRERRLPGLWELVSRRQFGMAMICYPVFFYRMRHFLILMVLLKTALEFPVPRTFGLVGEYLRFRLGQFWSGNRWRFGAQSLRRVVNTELLSDGDDPAMAPLRRGR